MKKLRLLVTNECYRDCEGCCNKQWDLSSLSVCEDFEGYDEVLLTGGEPLLKDYWFFKVLVFRIRKDSECKVYLYTAEVQKAERIIALLIDVLDGITLTLHHQRDVKSFLSLNKRLILIDGFNRSLRLNVFKGVEIPSDTDLSLWQVKKDMVWVENCPLPEDEIFMRL
jgi:hypothetical protein